MRLYNEVLRRLPDRGGASLRSRWLRHNADTQGDFYIGRGTRILAPEGLIVRRGVSVARDVTLDARGGLELQEDCLIGFESLLLTSTHNSQHVGVPVQTQGMYCKPIRIGRRAWLGTRTIVLPGVTIGDDAVVAAGAVVTRDVEATSVVAGVPARFIRQRSMDLG